MKDLTISNIERQNVLNNRFAVSKVQEHLDIEGMLFEGEYRFTKKMVADFYQVDTSTIDRYLQSNSDELKHNGYILCKGKQLKEFKLEFAHLINEASKTTQLGLFNFRSFLNMGMLLTESEKAKKVRSLILDFVITTINEKTGGGTKYINRRDVHYLPAAITEENYRKNLTSAIKQYVEGHPTYKYSQITDFIYKAVFKENAKEYREVLKLDSKDNVRHTLYSEVLLVISSFENGVGAAINERFKEILPNIFGQLIIMSMMTIPNAIFYEAYLAFVGLGLTVPQASLGTLINSGFEVFTVYPTQMTIPAIILAVLMLGFNLLGDGLRDALDPTMKEM